MKNKKWLWVVGAVLLGGILIFRIIKNLNNDDFKIAVVGDKGIMIRSISWERKMVNELWVEATVPIWIPEGMGWYQSGKVGQLLVQEKKENLVGQIMFYNFGVIPEAMVLGDDQGWEQNKEVIKQWGVGNWVRYLWLKSRLMVKRELIKTDLSLEKELLKEIMPRDFADNRLLREEIKLTVFNSGQSSGMAGFMAKVLEWSGFSVVGIDNYTGEIGSCQVKYGEGVEGSEGFKMIKKIFNSCEYMADQSVNEKEMELYFGDNYSRMLNYQSYVRSF